MNKFPLTKKLGLEVQTSIVFNYNRTERKEVNIVSAEALEQTLQNAQMLYFQKENDTFKYFRTDKNHSTTHAGLLLMPSEIFICKTHEPAFHDLVTECKHCGVKLKRGYTAEE